MPRGRKKKEPGVEFKPELDVDPVMEYDPHCYEVNPYEAPVENRLTETLRTLLGEAPEVPWTYTAQQIEDYRREYEVWKAKIRYNLR